MKKILLFTFVIFLVFPSLSGLGEVVRNIRKFQNLAKVGKKVRQAEHMRWVYEHVKKDKASKTSEKLVTNIIQSTFKKCCNWHYNNKLS
jgi:hypothetical protein